MPKNEFTDEFLSKADPVLVKQARQAIMAGLDWQDSGDSDFWYEVYNALRIMEEAVLAYQKGQPAAKELWT